MYLDLIYVADVFNYIITNLIYFVDMWERDVAPC